MKKLNYLFILTLLASVALFSSCETTEEIIDNPVDISQLTIAEYAGANENYSILEEALVKADLVSVLDGSSEYTVFAPDNDAFTALFEKLNITSIQDLSAETLKQVLLYHVMSGSMTSGMLGNSYYSSLSPAQGRTISMKISTDNGVMINNMAMVTNADINVQNGVIHGIDQVLLPPTIVDLAAQNGNFTSLVGAVTNAGLAETLSDPNASFTVFAPIDEAFAALGGNIPTDLTSILLYHVLGSPVYGDMVSSSIIKTLNPENPEIVVEVMDTGVKLNGKANVIITDIVGTNGVIHVIDQVIMPIDNNSILDIAMSLDDFSSLVAALASTNLASAFMDGGAFTVFAPTNQAFADFLELNNISFSDLTPEALIPVLMYHVVNGKAVSSSLSNGYINTLYEAMPGSPVSMLVETENGVKLNSKINVTAADVMASNGVIHVIDGVLMPTSVVDIAINNANFTYLVQAVVRAGLAETLSGNGPFTIFAPTDNAFETILSQLGLSSIEELDIPTLTSILKYHVVSGNVKSADLTTGSVATLNGDISVSIGDLATINGDAEIIATDIQGTNGIVHVINKVLIP